MPSPLIKSGTGASCSFGLSLAKTDYWVKVINQSTFTLSLYFQPLILHNFLTCMVSSTKLKFYIFSRRAHKLFSRRFIFWCRASEFFFSPNLPTKAEQKIYGFQVSSFLLLQKMGAIRNKALLVLQIQKPTFFIWTKAASL